MRRWGSWAAAAAALAATAADADTPAEIAPVVVVGVTPLPGAVIDPDRASTPIQTANGEDIARSHALDLSAFMNRELGGVFLNEVQGNPLQPDVNYRGYTGSPLLGAPQGLAVYVDGVRLNQPFGDVVSWDLIPKGAIASIALIPGSNPLFGLNSLGGALAIRTRDGRTDPGLDLSAGYGSHARRSVELTAGASGPSGLDGFLYATGVKDPGWRDASPTEAAQVFAKAGWRGGNARVALSGAFADTDLTGNGLQEQRLLARDRASVYTKPDRTRNRAGLLNLAGEARISDNVSVSGNAFHRQIRTRTLNGDINEESLTEGLYQPNAAERAALAAAGYSGVPAAGESAANTPFPSWRCIATGLLNTEPNEKCDGLLNRTRSRQRESGMSGQATGRQGRVELTVGAAYARSRVAFAQSSQFGYLAPDRGVVGIDAFADGSQDSENAFDARVELASRTRTASVYALAAVEVTPALRLTLSGRYDDTRVRNRDRLAPGGGPGSLDGDHRFDRLNPAAGVVFVASPALTAYANYGEGSRAPSAIELGCADPDQPCRLPNAMAGDPPLKTVVARTGEAGLRGRVGGRVRWTAGAFRAVNAHDILFVADDQAGFGYFKNVGRTRRQGIELGLNGDWPTVRASAHYTFLDATYRSAETLNGAGNSTNDGPAPGFEGAIDIAPGDRIPLVPRHVFKAQADWDATPRLTLSAEVVAASGVYARGNENDAHAPDGVFYLGPGRTKGYAVFNAGADFRPARGTTVFAQVENLFGRRYATAAQLGATGFTETGAFIARPFAAPVIDGERPVVSATFFAPGAPRTFWIGVRKTFGK